MHRSSFRYRAAGCDEGEPRERSRVLVYQWRRFACRRLWVLLHREGWGVNHKKICYSIHRLEGLALFAVSESETAGMRRF